MKQLIPFLFLICCFGCNRIALNLQTGEAIHVRTVDDYFEQSPTLQSYFTGYIIQELATNEIVFEQNADHYFIPASNTKLLTLYTATQVLNDSIPWMAIYNEDKLIHQPLGDPTFLHPNLPSQPNIESYFANLEADTVLFAVDHFQDQHFGSGWAWDDFEYSFQPEKSAFPIHSNYLMIENGKATPEFLQDSITITEEKLNFKRKLSENHFYHNNDDTSATPFIVNRELYVSYFKSIGKEVKFVATPSSPIPDTIYSLPTQVVYQELMQESDNHIAEQLLLQASQLQFGYMNTKQMIKYSKLNYFSFVPSPLNWVDGSGLSRYNLFTPRSLLAVMNQLVKEQGIDWIKEVFPAGGESGTIRNNYEFSPTRVYAKTGTLSNHHCLTGIVQAKSGTWYSFSFMNSNYPNSSSTAKAEMENVIQLLVERY